MSVIVNEIKFKGKNDSETLNNAVKYAVESGERSVTIPRLNVYSGKEMWSIDSAVVLPDNFTVIIDNAYLRQADGAVDNIFRNQNCETEFGKTLDGEQSRIYIKGIGCATLDGGKTNGITEQAHRDNPGKLPHISKNLMIYFVNVRDFEVSGLYIKDTRWWSMAFSFCRFGKISDIRYEMHATLENQDGINLRVGCNNITIENISGITGDDTVALTALPGSDWVKQIAVENKSVDIHDVTIRNVISASHGCNIIRFLNTDGAKIYNVDVSDIKDTGEVISGTAIAFGDTEKFSKIRPHTADEFYNIRVRNVTTCSQRGLGLCEPVRDLFIENYSTYGPNELGLYLTRDFYADNVVIRNFNFRSDADTAKAVIQTGSETPGALDDLKIERVRAGKSPYIFRIKRVRVDDFIFEPPTVAEYTPEEAVLDSAYGRYFRFFFGEEITNRPKDNRFSEN